ncbi:response regulator [Spirosoma aureum]|uniref:Response regulator n=1 Tax=Spirosoma aureum TaxID=2692134 RepID=A0A6G9AMB6_9BACT|nr:response regulator [Spirosoma aureum]QIP13476.1 response regulator [Spirosoma aureum]
MINNLVMKMLPLRVLLVDDDDEDRQLIREALTTAIDHILIEEMATGEELIKWLAHRRSLPSTEMRKESALVTIILLDMHMPKLTGLETLQSLGDTRDLAYMPVVLLTSSISEPLKQQAYEHGIHLYMVKPAGASGFYRVVEAVKLCYRDTLRMRDQNAFS